MCSSGSSTRQAKHRRFPPCRLMFKLFLASLALVLFQGDAQLRGARRPQDADPAAAEAPAEAPAETPAEAPAETPAEAPAAGGLTAAEQAQLNRDFVTAIRRQDTATAETLLASGAQIDDISNSGPHWSPLALACVSVDSTMALWLLEKGADPDVADNRGRTPLYHAVHYYMYDVVEEMLKTAKNLSPHDGDGVGHAHTRGVAEGRPHGGDASRGRRHVRICHKLGREWRAGRSQSCSATPRRWLPSSSRRLPQRHPSCRDAK